MAGAGWSCETCSFRHEFNGTRCSMCNSLRVTKEQMRKFIAGGKDNKGSTSERLDNHNVEKSDSTISLDKTSKNDNIEIPAPTNQYYKNTSARSQQQKRNDGLEGNKMVNHTVARVIVNPYSRKRSADDANLSNNSSMNRVFTQQNGQSMTEKRISQTVHNPYLRSLPQQQLGNNLSNPTGQNIQNHQRQENKGPVQSQINNTNIQINVSKVPNVNMNQIRNPSINHTMTSQSSKQQQSQLFPGQIHNTSYKNNTLKVQKRNTNIHPDTAQQKKVQKSVKKSVKGKSRPIPKQQKLSITLQPNNSAASESTNLEEKNIPFDNYKPGPVPLAGGDVHKNWIYPHSDKYPERDYQLSITRSSILQNTLVSLPTGLGKTLIAAVVMYNFYRWFPNGKIVFLAPTRPLVTQQIEACYNIMGIPEIHTAEMSGRTKPSERSALWKDRRLFFCTPQTFQKDIEEDRCDAKMVVCVVLDEAHKSTGNYAYVKVVELIEKAGAKFRVVGLSATPGKNLQHINDVVKALKISNIEARLDSDPEVKKYVHDREEELIIVEPTSHVNTVKYLFDKLLDPLLDRLRAKNSIRNFRGGNATITSYTVYLSMKQLNQSGNYSMNPDLLVTQALLRAREALRDNGTIHFIHNFFPNTLKGFFYEAIHVQIRFIRFGPRKK